MCICELINNIANKTISVFIYDSDETLLSGPVKAFRHSKDSRVIDMIDFDYANECIDIYLA